MGKAMVDVRHCLITAIRDEFRKFSALPDIGEDIRELLTETETLSQPEDLAPDPASHQALSNLPQPAEGALGEICGRVREAALLMPWHYSYGATDELAHRICFADLVGPTGPYVSDRLRLGLTLVGPNTLYPMHAHKARELYFVVSGDAIWMAGEVARRPAPGTFVLHRSDVPHSMQTELHSLLAIYIWRGDIFSPPYYI
jgi:mannose-6-phosphate isomerase-like protein (cupin superfamily)